MVLAFQADVESLEVWYHDNVAQGRGGGIAVLASGPNLNPQLNVLGDPDAVEGCAYRGLVGYHEYCSEFRGNTSSGGGGGLYMEDGTAYVANTAFLENDTSVQGSAIGLIQNTTHGSVPALTAHNVLVAENGTTASVDVVRVHDGTLAAQHLTSADNAGVPIRLMAGAAGSIVQRSIVWDSTLMQLHSSLTIDATCTMFRGVPLGGGTTVGSNRVFGLDPFFTTTTRGPYRLDSSSVNAINKCLLGLPSDLDGYARTLLFDRGAFEAP